MENSNQIKKISQGSIKAIKIIKIICFILAGILFAIGMTLSILTLTNVINNYIGNHLSDFESVNLTLNYSSHSSYLKKSIPLVEAYNDGLINEYLMEIAGDIFSGGITLLIVGILLNIFQKLFVKLNDSESPFNLSILKDVRNVFIVITVFVALKSIIMGVIVGLCLYCFYCIYKRGIELQNQADETL